MNIQQLEYILAVEEHRHFVRAAEACNITQPTLSAMIQKLEEELGLLIFDRSRQPVMATEEGDRILEQARVIIQEVHRLHDIASEKGEALQGSLKLGIIPTLAPYLLPLFLKQFTETHPKVNLTVQELNTDEILRRLERNEIDAGLLATPTKRIGFDELPVFYEKFLVYAGRGRAMPNKQFLLADDIDLDHLWLLEEGHCLRTQVIRLCELKKQKAPKQGLQYASGSIDALIRMVDTYQGITILPELAVLDWDKQRRTHLHLFADPVPEREISIVRIRKQHKKKIVDELSRSILENLPDDIARGKSGAIIPIV
ncbi:MAG: LysR family transcriptional regulator [Bacteroidetes bacterium]|nr:LysR family transcriptional regulator [Bacteroidota bacterium]